MIQIQTRENRNGRWYCFATFNGYDYSYIGRDKSDAQHWMKQRISKPDCKGLKFEWLPPVTYKHTKKELSHPHIGYKPFRIDKNPFA